MENSSINESLKNERIKYKVVFIILLITLVCVFFISVSMGTMNIKIYDILNVITSKIFGFETDVKENVCAVIWNIRIPVFCRYGTCRSGSYFSGHFKKFSR